MPINISNLTNSPGIASASIGSTYGSVTPELDLLAAQERINQGQHLTDAEIAKLLDMIGDNPQLREQLLAYAASRPSVQVTSVGQGPVDVTQTDAIEWSAPSTDLSLLTEK